MSPDKPYTDRILGDYIVRGRWTDRPMSVTDATSAVLEFASGLARIHPVLAPRWADDYHRLGDSWVQLEPDWVGRALEASRHTDSETPDWVAPPSHGYRIDWAAPWRSLILRMQFGQNESGRAGGNFVSLGFPKPDQVTPEMRDLYRPEIADAVTRLLIATWDPDYALWTGLDTIDAVQDPRPRNRVELGRWKRAVQRGEIAQPPRPLGWETYFHSEIPAVDATLLPHAAHVEQFHSGILIRLGDNPLDVPRELVERTRAAIGYPSLPSHPRSDEHGDG